MESLFDVCITGKYWITIFYGNSMFTDDYAIANLVLIDYDKYTNICKEQFNANIHDKLGVIFENLSDCKKLQKWLYERMEQIVLINRLENY